MSWHHYDFNENIEYFNFITSYNTFNLNKIIKFPLNKLINS